MTLRNDHRPFARDALGISDTVPLESSALGGRGSDRVYYRIRWGNGNSAILVEYDPRRKENAYFADIATFLDGIGVPVPHLIRHDPAAHLILMEDLGATDLWSLRGEPWGPRRLRYQKTLVVVDRLHSFPPEKLALGRVRLMDPFGPGLYRWEQDYFLEHFVKDLCNINLLPATREELDRELSTLAGGLSESSPRLVHRDLQSQNVMIHRDNPVLIDFQGMRLGSLFYDLGSLLYDPYVDFSDSERDELLAYYYGLAERNIPWPGFQNRFQEASIQRLMQALGAYGFLGLKRGMSAYLSHVPAGLHNLLIATEHARSLPHLRELCLACAAALHDRTF
jgi:aminoglycoside/choline kinase family phosphotransferase